MQWLLVAVIVLATTVSEVLQTAGMKQIGEIHDFRLRALRRVFARVARNWQIGLSIALLAVSFFAFVALLARADMSFAVPATAASYVIETILAKYVLNEQIGRTRWLSTGMVACGVALLAW